MDELDLLREMVAEYAELVRVLIENPDDAQALRKARHLLNNSQSGGNTMFRQFTIDETIILTLRGPTPQLGAGSRVRSYTHTPERAARIMSARQSIPNAITYIISKNHTIIQSQTQEEPQ